MPSAHIADDLQVNASVHTCRGNFYFQKGMQFCYDKGDVLHLSPISILLLLIILCCRVSLEDFSKAICCFLILIWFRQLSVNCPASKLSDLPGSRSREQSVHSKESII